MLMKFGILSAASPDWLTAVSQGSSYFAASKNASRGLLKFDFEVTHN